MDFSFLPSKNDYDAEDVFLIGPYVIQKCKFAHVTALIHLQDELNAVKYCNCYFCLEFCKDCKNGARSKYERSRPCATYLAAQFVKCALNHLLQHMKRPQCQWKFPKIYRRKTYLLAFQLLKDLSNGKKTSRGLLLKEDFRYISNFENKYKLNEEDREKLMVMVV